METKWIDAWIRWDRADDDNHHEAEEMGENPFQTDSSQDFSFSFHREDTDKSIQIHLCGYKPESEEAWSSTGLTIWRSGEYLCRYLASHPSLFAAQEKVLECGSGLGLCGILARMISSEPRKVVLTDGDTETLAQLRRNIKRNCENDTTISCRQLLWGLKSAKSFQSTHGMFDLILGSDLIYVKAVVGPLWDTVDTLLSDDGVFIMAYCARRTESERNVTLDDILEASRLAGFSNECVDTFGNEEGEDIYIHRFIRQKRPNWNHINHCH